MVTAPNIDFPAVVAAYGGFTKLAKRLGLTLSTVHGWHLRKSVPIWRRQQIAAAALVDGVDIERKRRKNPRTKSRGR